MNDKDKYLKTTNFDYKIQNKERGEILYYSTDQVADLLNENISNIKYYTNIFYDLLRIDIVDKELRFTNNDINKLESLIKFKNKGMTTKEIEIYFNKLPSSDKEIKNIETNLLSVEELIDSIKKEQELHLNDFKVNLLKDMQESNTLYLKSISSEIIDAQNKLLIELKRDLSIEIKEYINSKIDDVTNMNIELNNKFIENTNNLISEKISEKNHQLKTSLQNDFNNFTISASSDNDHLIKEIRDFKSVIKNAYYIESEVSVDTSKISFWKKLFA